MAYDEYDYSNESNAGSPSLKESLYNILNGLQNEKNLRETGEGLTRLRNAFPGVAESVGRGAIASVPGAIGDISDFARSYAPETMNDVFGARAFNTTREILNNIPRITPSHEGAETLEDVGAAISPGVGGVVKDVAMLGKGLPVGLSIKDVSKEAKAIDELGFHSTLQKAVNNIGQPKGTGEQFLKQLEKTPGVKTEELETTGLKKYLQDNPTVTKQEVQDLIENNKVKLENKVLGESTGESANDYKLEGGDIYHDQDYIDSLTEDLHSDLINDPDIYHQKQQELVERFPELYEGHESDTNVAKRLNDHVEESLREQAQQQSHDMYYDDPIRHYYDEHGYDVYGNENTGYSIKDSNGIFVKGPSNGLYDISDTEDWLRQHHLEEGNIDEYGGGAKYEDYTLPGNYKNYREILTTLPNNSYGLSREFDELSKFKRENPSEWTNNLQNELDLIETKLNNNFESGHYDEPNILAHMRVNDRNINGKKTLMVEEIQSDWHQAGRKKGYDTPEVRKNIANERQKLLDQKDHFAELAKPYTDLGKDAPPEIVDGWTKAANGLQELQKVENSMRNAVPDAPFKKNWHELMVKQALDMAAKGDYDAIAFTTGKQQAARYNLSKQIDALDLIPAKESDKQFVLQAWKDGRNVVRKTVNENELADYVGKEVAEKLLAQEPKGLHRPEGIAHGNPNVFEGRELTGLDLETGGEGMKGFYDKIIPDYVNKYGKKWGMAMRKANTQASLQGEQVHFVELTDAAKKDIKEKGQPMFAGIGLAGIPMMGPDDQKKHGILKDIAKSKK